MIKKHRIPGILLLLFFLIHSTGYSQQPNSGIGDDNVDVSTQLEQKEKRFSFGFLVGMNLMDFSVNTGTLSEYNLNSAKASAGFGLQIGLLSSFSLSENLSLRLIPTFVLGERSVDYDFIHFDHIISDENKFAHTKQHTEVASLELPFNFQYKFTNNSRFQPFVLCGIKYSYDLSASQYRLSDGAYNPLLFKVGHDDIHIEVGTGIKRVYSLFSLSTEVKFSFGLNDLIHPGEYAPPYYESIEGLRSRSIMLSLVFQ